MIFSKRLHTLLLAMPTLTADQAREMQVKAVASRRKSVAELQAAAAIGRAMSAKAVEMIQSSGAGDANAEASASVYLSNRLVRVREQIASLEERLTTLLVDSDPIEAASAIDRLCAAKAKLSEEERILAGRPLPGSHRPRQSAGPRRPSAADPLAE